MTAELARRNNLSEETVSKWRGRESVNDASHTTPRLRRTRSSAREAVPVVLRRTLVLPLDDLKNFKELRRRFPMST